MAFNVTSSYTIRRTRRKNQQKRSSPRIQQGRPHLQEHIAMSRNLLLVLFAVATFLHGSEAQAPAPKATSPISPPRSTPAPGPSSGSVTYTVGETAGWIVPGNASFYPAWASAKNFKVGDILGKSSSSTLIN